MHKRLRASSCFGFVRSLCLGLGLTLSLGLTGCGQDQAASIDALLTAYSGPNVPGAAVLVIRNGEKVFERGYGMADVEAGTPVTSATNFRLASLTKQFTAMAVMMLVEDGKLRLDTPLTTLFPSLQPFASEMTVQHLLQHQSGLPDYEPMVPKEATEQVHDRDVLTLMASVDSGLFSPGSAYHYSNSGYALLALLVEQQSGQSFSQFLEARIFATLGMNNTVAFVDGVTPLPNRALGYRVTDTVSVLADQSLYSAVLGDGGIYSSLDDLYRWDQALYADNQPGSARSGPLVSAEALALMRQPDKADYGFGWRIDRYRGTLRYHHSGSTSGFRHFMQHFPDLDLTVILLTNRAEPDVKPVAEQIGDLFL